MISQFYDIVSTYITFMSNRISAGEFPMEILTATWLNFVFGSKLLPT